MFNDYWTGIAAAHLERSQITAAWGHGDQSSTSILFVNAAFGLYYQARQNINACSDSEMRSRMAASLATAGRTGWSITSHPGDLEEAFEHLVANHGNWTDTLTDSYFGDAHKLWPTNLVYAPASTVCFMNAMDHGRSALRRYVTQFGTMVERALAARDGGNWQLVGETLGQCDQLLNEIMPFLWFVPDHIQDRREGMVPYVSALANVQGGMTTGVDYAAAGADTRMAIGMGVLSTAIRFLPILGAFYAEALEAGPRVVRAVRDAADARYERIDSVAAGARR